jgi:ribonuclease HI
MPYYAVRSGKKPGIYKDWLECQQNVIGFKNAKYKKFNTIDDAKKFIDGELLENIKKENKELKELNKKLDKINNTSLKSKNSKIQYIYYYNYPGFMRPIFRQKSWNQYYYIFTDGSNRKNPELQFKSGYGVYFYSPSVKNQSGRNNKTNNYCETIAIKYALERIQQLYLEDEEDTLSRKFIIVSDSQYCIKSITQYTYIWKLKDWKRPGNKDIQHINLWKEIYNILARLDNLDIPVGFMHVRSHMKEPSYTDSFEYFLWYGNNCADSLAVGKKLPIPRLGFQPFKKLKDT